MRIILVRHGHPDYINDCLTATGREQARLAAERLRNEGISEIFTSPYGRAVETAQRTADMLGLPVTQLPFMHEIKWGGDCDIYAEGHPWDTSMYAVSLGHSLMDESWTKLPPFAGNRVWEDISRIAASSDVWMRSLGYTREGTNYRVTGSHTDRAIALFSHGGSSSALLSHMLNIPFFYLCRAVCPDFTAVTVLCLDNIPGTLTAPQIEIMNDARHIRSEGISYKM